MTKFKVPTFKEVKDWFSNGNADVTVNSLEALTDFTDPSGTSHTSELADSNDIVDDYTNLTNTPTETSEDNFISLYEGGYVTRKSITPSWSYKPESTNTPVTFSGSGTIESIFDGIKIEYTYSDRYSNGRVNSSNSYITVEGNTYSLSKTNFTEQFNVSLSEQISYDYNIELEHTNGSTYTHEGDISLLIKPNQKQRIKHTHTL